MSNHELPDAVQRKCLALGEAGQRWLANLSDLVGALEREWRIEVGAALGGGSEAYVARATANDGRRCVIKLLLPSDVPIEREIIALRIANGRGYAQLLRYNEACGAMLLEELGVPLDSLGLSTREQMKITCAALQRSWLQVPDNSDLLTGSKKAQWLRDFIVETWDALQRPCSAAAVAQVRSFAAARIDAFDPHNAVLVHGDAHGANTLQVIGAVSGDIHAFKLVDPDGLLAEPAYDLAIAMRDWSEELLAGDALQLGRQRCEYLSYLTDVDPLAIWQWGFLERMSTGLYLLKLGYDVAGRDMLRVAERWVE